MREGRLPKCNASHPKHAGLATGDVSSAASPCLGTFCPIPQDSKVEHDAVVYNTCLDACSKKGKLDLVETLIKDCLFETCKSAWDAARQCPYEHFFNAVSCFKSGFVSGQGSMLSPFQKSVDFKLISLSAWTSIGGHDPAQRSSAPKLQLDFAFFVLSV